jgi:hypothetical protein
LSTVQWYIWKAYWNFVFDHIPFRLDPIVTHAITQVSVLLTPVLTYDD